MKACYLCGDAKDTRPYGPGGKTICYGCMKADPEREREAERQMAARFAAIPGIVVIDDEGFRPANYAEAILAADIVESIATRLAETDGAEAVTSTLSGEARDG